MSQSASISFRVDAPKHNPSSTSGKKMSLTFRVDNGVIEHNNRDFVAKNVVRERISQNIVYKREDIREKYHELFDEALEEYNARQKRADRKIEDYYQHMKKSQKEKPYYEIVVQVGDIDNCGYGKENYDDAVQILDEYMRHFEENNPNMKVFNAVMHLDEATPHLHIDFLPICHNQRQGLPTRISLKQALEEQNITSKSKKFSEWQAWSEVEKKRLAALLKQRGFTQEHKSAHYAHMSVDEYKEHKQQLEQMNRHINALKAKRNDEIATEDIAAIKNQNDFMRSEIQKRDEKIKILAKRAGAKFVPFNIYSQDKISFVTEELQRSNIPFVESISGIYIPEWAQKPCAAIAEKYQPPKNNSIKSAIQLDIDTLIYSSENLNDLLTKLKEKGYQIKEGKYLAVKHPTAQRFVRLKSLGDDYVPQNIEKRIASKDKFPNAVQSRSKNANDVEQRYYTTITETIIAIRTLKFKPRKLNPQQIYSYENDYHINQLSQQLIMMNEMQLTNRDSIYNAAEELQKKIDEKKEKVKQLSDEIPTLKSDIEQIKYFFSAMKNGSSRLDTMQQVKLAAAKEIAEKYNINSPEDAEPLEQRLKYLPMYISSIREEITNEQLKLQQVSELIQTYETIVEGNYIDNLIAAERERMERSAEKKNNQSL